MNEETEEQQKKRLATIRAALQSLIKDHGPLFVATAIQAIAIESPEYMHAAMGVSLLARDVVRQKRLEEANTCQCAECRSRRAQA